MEQQKTKESKKRYFAYDLMRAAAMLLIVFYHMNCEWSARLMESPLVVTKIGNQGYLGWQGVSLFILVSGAAQCISSSPAKANVLAPRLKTAAATTAVRM